MATLILTAVGTAIGGPLGGAIGALAGRAFDQAVLMKPKGREGPRLSELQVQTSSYGSQVPQIFGAMRVAGTVIWATDLRESKTKKSGGKGQASVTSYSYSASFAVALSSRRVRSVRRIWADGNLLRGGACDFKSAVGAFRLHEGAADQAADPLIASAQGIGVTPAHRGLAYAVFEDLQLADFGNRIPSLTFEIVADDAPVDIGEMAAGISGGLVNGNGMSGEAIGTVAGYAASGVDARAALRPLAEAWDLQLREGADGLELVKAGMAEAGTAEVAVTRAMLAARINGKAGPPMQRSRATAEGVPVRLTLRHYDPARDYQAGVQAAVRGGAGRRVDSIDLPAVLEAGAARARAEARLAALWAARGGIELLCGWEALSIVPGTVVEIAGVAGTWRLILSEWEAMGVRLTLRRVAAAGGADVIASPGAAVLQPDLPHGATLLRLFDLPGIGDAPATAPVVVAAAAGASDGWRKAALFAVTPGTGEAIPVGETALPARMGVVVTPPGPAGAGGVAGVGAGLFDLAGAVEVEMLAEWMTPDQADDAALARGANLCAVGSELMQFGTATQTGPRRFRLTRLWRGRRGTEWAIGAHEAGEPFLLIEPERLFAVPGDVVHAGTGLSMIAIGIGDTEPASAYQMVDGAALMPLSPTGITLSSDGAGGKIIGWTRRSRAGWRWSDGIDAPLGEEREAYAIRLLDGDVVVRTAESDSPSWTYDAAMAASDLAAGHGGPLGGLAGGSPGGPLVVEVRQIGTHARGRAALAAIL